MSGVKDSFLDLERHRAQLEDNINGLKKALTHWRTWDLEYEALKEEVEAVPAGDADASQATELRRIQDAFEGELLDKDEVSEIFGQQKLKTPSQINNILERRIDYVTKNIETLSKQLEGLENKYAAATVISQPDATDEDGQPITEIVEELDEDDNVLSYRLMQPGDSMSHVRDALEKAGVKNMESQGSTSQVSSELQTGQPSKAGEAASSESQISKKPASSQPTPKKGVSFHEDTKPGHESPPSPQMSRTAKRVARIMEDAKAQENWTSDAPVIPDDEDPEDAALRQEMLKYSMGEVGAVVAELQLEEMESDEEMEDFGYSDEEDVEEEDQYGRSKGSVLTDDYRTRMLELEKKLGISSRFTQGPVEVDEDSDSDSNDEGVGRIVVKHEPSSAKPIPVSPAPPKSALKSAVSEKKGVRFSENLDIAPAEQPATSHKASPDQPVVDPLSDVVERVGAAKPAAAASARKPSRFKRSRDDLPPNNGIPKGPFDVPTRLLDEPRDETPTGPEGQTIADTLVERDTPSKPVHFDDIDDSMIQAEVADEHQRLRRKFIQREGGFLKEEESAIQPLDETEGGGERVSRFKAARLSQK
jgi:unconventional prefoldin RPB5 interactor 1